MPTLSWIGKDKIVKHHREVPYCTLERIYSYDHEGQHEGDNNSENMIIHGDNLQALKALLPKYEGKIDCIYIDPPYNTGEEKWVYNDNVNDPTIIKWLGEVVGKDGEDMTRHDKWLCMMYPRLRLLREMLSPEGAIFISISDIEYANLKSICDEIFGASCFISNISWQKTYSTRNDSKGIVEEVEHILVYSRNTGWNPKKIPRTADMDSKYKNPDNDKEPWTSSDAFAADASTHQGMVYAIQHPFSGEMIYPYSNGHWRYNQDQMMNIMNGWTDYELRDIEDAKIRASICGIPVEELRNDVKAIVLSKSKAEAAEDAKKILERGQWPRFYFTKNGKGGIRKKTYLSEVEGTPPTNFWPFGEVGHTDEAKKEIISLFDGKSVFDTPKPTRLLEYILSIATDKDSIVLDSYAGSGTTAHAVINVNRRDNGNRRFILVELLDYAETITAERVKRAIGRMEPKDNRNESFSFYELGEQLIKDDVLNETVDDDVLRQYVLYSETKMEYSRDPSRSKYFLGAKDNIAYYFLYEKGATTVFDDAMMSGMEKGFEGYVVYAEACYVPPEILGRNNITFKKIPRDIRRF